MAYRQDMVGENHGSAKWVFCADSRIAQKDLADDSVSLVLTDPPYGIDGMDEAWDHGKLNGRVKPGVVGGLPAGMKFSRSQGPRLYDFLAPVATEWARILKPGGFVLCFSQARLTHHVAMAIENAGFEIRDLLAWQYEGQAKAFSQEHFVRKRADLSESEKADIIERLGGRKTPQLKPQMETIALGQLPRDGAYWENWVKHGVGLIDASDPFIQPDKFPGQIIPARKERRRFNHMTVKPVPLLRHLIRLFSKEGEDSIILDPFAGTGSTGVAARLEGRGFIGFEKERAHGENGGRESGRRERRDERADDCLGRVDTRNLTQRREGAKGAKMRLLRCYSRFLPRHSRESGNPEGWATPSARPIPPNFGLRQPRTRYVNTP